MIKLSNIIIEVISVKDFVEYYRERAEELKNHYGYEGDVTGDFYFERYEGKLAAVCEVVHSDTILNSSKQIDANTFILPKSLNKKKYTLQPFNFNVSDCAVDVVRSLNMVGVNAEIGLLSRGKGSMVLGSRSMDHITVNCYTGDSLTTQMDINSVERNLLENPDVVIKAMDTFIIKMIETIKVLETKFYPSSIT